MKKYHVATGDGKAYYGVGYESYRQAEGILKISQIHDPQAHIVEEEYHFTNADRIRAMSDEELYDLLKEAYNAGCDDATAYEWGSIRNSFEWTEEWLKQPAE